MLELPFFETEVHAALMDMNGDKALGPDGFTVRFWQSCWDFVKEEILDMLRSSMSKILSSRALTMRFWSCYRREGGLRTLGIIDPSAC